MSLKTFEFLFKYNNGVYELFSSPAEGTQSANKRSEVPTWFCTARVYCTSFVGNEFKNASYTGEAAAKRFFKVFVPRPKGAYLATEGSTFRYYGE